MPILKRSYECVCHGGDQPPSYQYRSYAYEPLFLVKHAALVRVRARFFFPRTRACASWGSWRVALWRSYACEAWAPAFCLRSHACELSAPRCPRVLFALVRVRAWRAPLPPQSSCARTRVHFLLIKYCITTKCEIAKLYSSQLHILLCL